ncbi:MAG: Na/Pi cotransporter family protein [Spirochaetes bacterium]|nr:Na/Pi cotransporter family protein [Spirochaetota bacterium]
MNKIEKAALLIIVFFLFINISTTIAHPYIIKAFNKNQEGSINKLLKKPFIIKVTDKKGNPVPDMRIEAICIIGDKKSKLLNPEYNLSQDKKSVLKIQKHEKFKTSIKLHTDKNGLSKFYFKNGAAIRQYKIIANIYTKQGYTTLETIEFTSMGIDITNILFYVLGGLGLFLFGMKLLSDGLQSTAGDRMKTILGFLSKNKYMGILVGFMVTAVLQSSSVTTVMLVGFVNAGLMSFAQTIGVIMGANIGTTITGFIISLKIGAFALPIIGIGFLISFLSKTRNIRFWGQVLLGFGILFLGLNTMGMMLKPLRDSVTLSNFFIQFATNPMLAVIAGMIVTFIIQSSSATLGLVITLGISGLIDIQGAFALVLGSNIGTTITAQLAAIGGNIHARRLAMFHSIFKVLGVIIMLIVIQTGLIRYYYQIVAKMVGLFTSKNVALMMSGKQLLVQGGNIALFIAFSHAIFNIANTVIFLPFVRILQITIEKIFKGKETKKFQYLEPHLLNTPALALAQTTHELSYMLTTARKMVEAATKGLFSNDKKWHQKFENREDKVDSLQKDITEYLVQLTQRQMTESEAEVIPKLIHAVNDIERIGDLSENIVDTAVESHEKQITFTEEAENEIFTMQNEIDQMINMTLETLIDTSDEKAKIVLEQEEKINTLEEDYRKSHIKRLKNKECDVMSGIYFLEIISNFERIGDHLSNVAKAVFYSKGL